ncbi:MAG: aminotransferase class V-fold PLP-dependent enzyme [Gammaproteobacteria bacterium]
MHTKPLLSPDAFIGLDGVAHLCTGGEAPWLKGFDDVYSGYVRLKSAGHAGREEVYARAEACRDKMERLWGVPAQRIAFMPSAAEGMNWLARGLDWRKGDNIVTTNLEFPSVAFAWKNLHELGVEVRIVPHRGWLVHEEDLLEAVDARTRVLAVSQVSFYTGQCVNVQTLAEGLQGSDTLFALDATHASGVLGVPASVTDLCVSSAYKWMLTTQGVAPCYLSERAEAVITTTSFGWHNMPSWPPHRAADYAQIEIAPMPARIVAGNPAMSIIMFLDHALDVLLDIGIARIETHARDLSEQAHAGLRELGLDVITPEERAARSGNTAFIAEDPGALMRRLAERDVLVWGDAGRLRVSGHLYNGSDDLERLLAALPGLI